MEYLASKGLPFKIRVSNETTLRTFQNTDAGKGVVLCKDANDLFEQLGFESTTCCQMLSSDRHKTSNSEEHG